MKKDYSTKNGQETSYLLSKDLFYISIDTIASMHLSGSYADYLDVIDGEVQTIDHRKKKAIYATIYDLVKLHQGGHRIEIINLDDVLNIYNLIHKHLENIDNLINKSVNPIALKNQEGLTMLAMLADEVLDNNMASITEETMESFKNRKTIFTSIGISSGSLMDRYYAKHNIARASEAVPISNSGATQHDVALNKVKRTLEL